MADFENPYAPTANPYVNSESGNFLPEQRPYAAFVGPRANYYLGAWKYAISVGIGKASFNLAAFLVPGFWFGYRKMYTTLILFDAFVLAELVIEQTFCELVFGAPDTSTGWDLFTTLSISLVCGFWGNTWYFNRAKRVIAAEQSKGLSGAALEQSLRAKGGTSVLLGIVCLIVFIVFSAAVTIGLEMFFHPDMVLFE